MPRGRLLRPSFALRRDGEGVSDDRSLLRGDGPLRCRVVDCAIVDEKGRGKRGDDVGRSYYFLSLAGYSTSLDRSGGSRLLPIKWANGRKLDTSLKWEYLYPLPGNTSSAVIYLPLFPLLCWLSRRTEDDIGCHEDSARQIPRVAFWMFRRRHSGEVGEDLSRRKDRCIRRVYRR
jgi:hypothetical protein